jgi:multidrug efflux pump subunit AcrB
MRGAIAWMARNGVAANLLMVFIGVSGVFAIFNIPQEIFPEFSLEAIQVRVEYPGASPEEVEQSIVQRVEEQIGGISGVRRVSSSASENVGVVLAELALGTDVSEALDEIKAEVDRITSFPVDAEEPEVTALEARSQAMQIAVHGAVPERTLKELANRVKDDLSSLPEISLVRVSGVRAYEISIEVSKDALRRYGLTLQEISGAVRRGSLDLPGGSVETDREEILVRVEGQNYTRADFEDIVVRAEPNGATLRVGDVADVSDGFEDADLISTYDGENTAFVQVFRTGDERVLEIVAEVERYLDTELAGTLPRGVEADVWRSEAEYLQDRLSLMVKNGRIGLILVIAALALFLNVRLAFWVSVGIFLSFTGTFAVMGALGVSINMMSLFGFILAIGIVVDDAIVVGENIYAERERGTPPHHSAVRGAQRVSVPVTFAVLTTVAAFTPLLFIPGSIGKFLYVIPIIVISVLLLSLIESLFILPFHLSHLPPPSDDASRRRSNWFLRIQGAVQDGLDRFTAGPLDRGVSFAVRRPGLVLLWTTTALLLVGGLVAGRYIRFSLLPVIEGEEVIAYLEMPEGTTSERTQQIAAFVEQAGREAARELQSTLPEDHDPLVEAVYTSVGQRPSIANQPGLSAAPTFVQSNIAEITFRLGDAERRDVSAEEVANAWRDRVGTVPSARALTFSAELINLGAPVSVELSHPDLEGLDASVAALEERLSRVSGVIDIRNDRGEGKRELELRLKPAATTLGITLDDLARQVRGAFFGDEALRLQRGRDEVRVYVRLPRSERDALADLNDYRIRPPMGGEVPLSEVADLEFGVGASTIRRIDGRRIVEVTTEVNRSLITGQEVNTLLESDVLPELQTRFPGLRYGFGGEQREQAEALGGMSRGFGMALLAIYALLAIPFRSYVQPLVIMTSIPLGFIGAALGHLIMGMDFGMLSMFGIVGLSGVVVNDSLVLMDFVNERHRSGLPMGEAIVDAARVRFRPILLTSLTTFLGVFPLIIERSIQAQFLIPMAVSLGFGILFATGILMLCVPALAMFQYQTGQRIRARWKRDRKPDVDLGWAGEG